MPPRECAEDFIDSPATKPDPLQKSVAMISQYKEIMDAYDDTKDAKSFLQCVVELCFPTRLGPREYLEVDEELLARIYYHYHMNPSKIITGFKEKELTHNGHREFGSKKQENFERELYPFIKKQIYSDIMAKLGEEKGKIETMEGVVVNHSYVVSRVISNIIKKREEIGELKTKIGGMKEEKERKIGELKVIGEGIKKEIRDYLVKAEEINLEKIRRKIKEAYENVRNTKNIPYSVIENLKIYPFDEIPTNISVVDRKYRKMFLKLMGYGIQFSKLKNFKELFNQESRIERRISNILEGPIKPLENIVELKPKFIALEEVEGNIKKLEEEGRGNKERKQIREIKGQINYLYKTLDEKELRESASISTKVRSILIE